MWDPSAALPIFDRIRWYIGLAATATITEEATAVTGGLLAHDGHIRLLTAGFAVSLGTWVPGVGVYWLGRWHGSWFRQKFPGARKRMLTVLRIARRHPWRSSLAVRFAYGLRLAVPAACGVARVPIPIFLIGSAISCLVWGYAFTLLGWGFGHTTLLLLGHVKRYEDYLVVLILIACLVGLLIMRKRHIEDRSVQVLSVGDEEQPEKLSD